MPLGVAARRKITMRNHPHEDELGFRESGKNGDPYPSSSEDDDDDDDLPSTTSENSSLLDMGTAHFGGTRSGQSFSSRFNVFLKESLVLPLMMMYFVMLLINTILRDTKDTMLV